MSEYESRGLGLIQSEPDPRDFIFGVTYKAEPLPENFQIDVSGVQVHDQGEYQNCGTHALAACVEILLSKVGKYKPISFPWYYGNRRYTEYQGEGTEARGLLKAAQKDGGLAFARYPFEEEMVEAMHTFNSKYPQFKDEAQNIRIKNYYQCAGVEDVKQALYNGYPVLVGTIVFKSFYEITAENPVMPEPRINGTSLEPMAGGHMMLIVGWNQKGFTVLNSWGEGFGKKGLSTMPYSIVTWSQRNNFPLPLFEAWAIDGVYIDGKLLEAGSPPVDPPVVDSGWYKQNGKWRYRENSKDVTGWKQVKGVWYYLKPDGYMTTGWVEVDGKWYYLKANGAMNTGWLLDKNKWYYLKPNGEMAIGWQKVDNVWYYLNAGGAMKTGWLKEKGEWYYLNDNGAMLESWQKIDGRWYYFEPGKGNAARGFRTIAGKDYYFFEKSYGDVKECQMLLTDGSGAIVP